MATVAVHVGPHLQRPVRRVVAERELGPKGASKNEVGLGVAPLARATRRTGRR